MSGSCRRLELENRFPTADMDGDIERWTVRWNAWTDFSRSPGRLSVGMVTPFATARAS